MRPCTPLTSASTPRESAFKPVPHPAAPVGEPSQTRRHHLTPTPVQQLCTHVQSCGQSAFFSYTGRGAFSFWRNQKENGGRICLAISMAEIPASNGTHPPEVSMDRLHENRIYTGTVESYSSEQNSRMMAMQAATKSAQDMLDELAITYNRVRQAAITQEITEVISGAKAQKKKKKK